jgi:hypothetical protein
MTRANLIEQFNAARQVGFSPARAARWAAYVQWKTRTGQEPIALWEAVVQVEAARS